MTPTAQSVAFPVIWASQGESRFLKGIQFFLAAFAVTSAAQVAGWFRPSGSMNGVPDRAWYR